MKCSRSGLNRTISKAFGECLSKEQKLRTTCRSRVHDTDTFSYTNTIQINVITSQFRREVKRIIRSSSDAHLLHQKPERCYRWWASRFKLSPAKFLAVQVSCFVRPRIVRSWTERLVYRMRAMRMAEVRHKVFLWPHTNERQPLRGVPGKIWLPLSTCPYNPLP